MSELLPVFIATMILAWFSEKQSIPNKVYEDYLKKDIFMYTIMAIILAVFVGLRVRYNDTTAYRHAYEIMPCDFSGISWSIGDNPGFNFINRCMKMLGFSTQDYLMFYAFITVLVYLWFIRKYTKNIWLSIFLFMVSGSYTFTMAAIKQCVAVAFCMIATDRFLNKKRVVSILWILLACTFHPYSFMYFILPFLNFQPWTIKTYLMIGIWGVVGVGLESMLGTIVDITSMMGEEYTVGSFSGDGVNIFRLLVVWVPVLVSFLARKELRRSEDKKYNLLINLTILRAEIMFIALFGTANYFARLANYFCMFQLITLPYMFKFYNQRSKRFLTVAMVICYMAYFYYSQAILYGGFDRLFGRISFIEYISTLL